MQHSCSQSLLEVHCSGFYAWLQQPPSSRAREDQRLAGKIEQFWLESGCVYGYSSIMANLKHDGGDCGKHKLLPVMQG
jgi:putative transposase